jgi:hypothetical protein
MRSLLPDLKLRPPSPSLEFKLQLASDCRYRKLKLEL